MNNDVIINHSKISSESLSNLSLEHSNGLEQTGQMDGPNNSVPSIHNDDRAR